MSHDITGVHTGVDTNNVGQYTWAHGPAELGHHLIDVLDIDSLGGHGVKGIEIGKQDAIDQEAWTVIDDHRALAQSIGKADQLAQSGVVAVRPTNHFDQWHQWHRIKEVQSGE